jgi:hypothetical protein
MIIKKETSFSRNPFPIENPMQKKELVYQCIT